MRVSFAMAERFLAAGPTIQVRIEQVQGSSPRDVGAWMLVNAQGAIGTIGGGQLEYMMIDEARKMLRQNNDQKTCRVPLGPEIGQCCGGHVTIDLATVTSQNEIMSRLKKEKAAEPEVLIFGAGHVGKALADALILLPMKPVLIDQRPEELSKIEHVETRLVPLPEAEVRSAKDNSAIVIVTHDHALDFLIAGEALNRKKMPYVGMIGSATKKAVFNKWYGEHHGRSASNKGLVCPIGFSGVKDKRPEVIAALVAAQIVTAFDQWRLRKIDFERMEASYAQ